MASDNFVSLTGNVTKDPELRFTNGGQAVLSFGIAVNRRWQNKATQEWEEQVSFFDIVAWRDLANNSAESLTKGDRITVTGRLEQRSWDDKNTGDKRSKIEIVADEVAPSLRWATAQVTRNERRDGDGGGRPAPRPAAAGNQPSSGGYGYDEEPF